MSRSALVLVAFIHIPAAFGASPTVGQMPPVEVVVRVHESTDVPSGLLFQSQHYVREIFGKAGLKVRFQRSPRGCADSVDKFCIDADFRNASPKSRPGVLGLAHPFRDDGVKVEIYYSRLDRALQILRPYAGRILAHVLAHEIAHVLTRIPDHVDDGLMKAAWDREDLHRMATEDLTFGERDLQAMRETLDMWHTRQSTRAGLPTAASTRTGM